MAKATSGSYFKLNEATVAWLKRQAEARRTSMKDLIETLVERASRAQVEMPAEAEEWIVAEARRRRISHGALLGELIENYQPDPSAYYLHAAALQSWITARLQAIMLMDNTQIDFQQTYDLVVSEARAVFGPDPLPGGQRPSSPTTPKMLRRLFTDVPEFVEADRPRR